MTAPPALLLRPRRSCSSTGVCRGLGGSSWRVRASQHSPGGCASTEQASRLHLLSLSSHTPLLSGAAVTGAGLLRRCTAAPARSLGAPSGGKETDVEAAHQAQRTARRVRKAPVSSVLLPHPPRQCLLLPAAPGRVGGGRRGAGGRTG